MATESPVLAQLRQQQLTANSSASYLVDKPVSDPLNVVQEMALSAVIQQHNSSAPPLSSAGLVQPSTPSIHNNGAVIKSYYMQTSAGNIATVSLQSNVVPLPDSSAAALSTSSSAPLSSFQPSSSSCSPPLVAGQYPQGPSVLLGPGAGNTAAMQPQQQTNYIALHSPSPSSSGPTHPGGGQGGMAVLAHQQPGPAVIQPQATPIKLPQLSGQFQEAGAAGTSANMMQLTPVTYGATQPRTLQTTPTPTMGNLQQGNLQQGNIVG